MAKKGRINDDVILAYALKNAVEHDGEARVESVISGLFAEGLKKEKIKDVMVKVKGAVNSVNSMDIGLQKAKLTGVEKLVSHRKVRSGLPALPGARKGKVVMRFRPSPSGPLHVGHIISNMISSLFAKKYKGKFYVVIDDTNPEEAVAEAYLRHKKDCDWIFGNVTKYLNSSDNIRKHYAYAEKLIRKRKAYVCTCSREKFKKLVDSRKPCLCRQLSVKENFSRWKKMLDIGKEGFKPGEAVLRFKSSVNNPNPAMRDFPLARVCLTRHPKQGNKYRVWPLMNLAVAVDDIEMGMTHIIRGKDHRDNANRQRALFKAFRKKFPWTTFMGRIKFTDMVLSKRRIEAAIREGKYKGWDDPRLPTIAGLRKRGYKPEAFWKMAEQRGISEVDKVISQKDFFEVLGRFNRL